MPSQQTWLKPNRRALLLGMIMPVALCVAGSVVVAADAGRVMHMAGWFMIGLAAIILLLLLRALLQPRLAYRPGELLVYVKSGGPVAVPIEIVECFFLGSSKTKVPGAPEDEGKVSTVVVRLAESAHQWKEREVKPALGAWRDGYITIRGMWCEPIDLDVVKGLNEKLCQARTRRDGGHPMTRLLVSVRNAAEATQAVGSGADLIDVKEPRFGSLGAASSATVRAVVRAVQGRVPVSVALGELHDLDSCDAAIANARVPGVGYAKLGLAGCGSVADWKAQLAHAFADFPNGVQRVAVVYADWQLADAPAPKRVMDVAQYFHCAAVLLDTFDKTRGALLDHWKVRSVERFVDEVQSSGMKAVVAGSLDAELALSVLNARPEYIAVRGAVCRGDRTGVIEAEKVNALAELVRRGTSPGSPCPAAGDATV